jgi:PqqD family protein of HPr-rel-A system
MGRLPQLAINDEGFVFDPVRGESYTVNKTGLLILRELKAGKSQEDIVKKLVETFDIDEEKARIDLIDFIDRLRSLDLI